MSIFVNSLIFIICSILQLSNADILATVIKQLQGAQHTSNVVSDMKYINEKLMEQSKNHIGQLYIYVFIFTNAQFHNIVYINNFSIQTTILFQLKL